MFRFSNQQTTIFQAPSRTLAIRNNNNDTPQHRKGEKNHTVYNPKNKIRFLNNFSLTHLRFLFSSNSKSFIPRPYTEKMSTGGRRSRLGRKSRVESNATLEESAQDRKVLVDGEDIRHRLARVL